jgi:hypothetical protein
LVVNFLKVLERYPNNIWSLKLPVKQIYVVATELDWMLKTFILASK